MIKESPFYSLYGYSLLIYYCTKAGTLEKIIILVPTTIDRVKRI